MTFLAPWALVIGGLAAAGAVLLHLVARQRPAAYVFPTTRFIPDRRTLVSRVAKRPRDLVLLALRVLLLLSAAAAFARPVFAPPRRTNARIVLLDRSRAVANPARAVAQARSFIGEGVPVRMIAFDSVATLVPAAAALESLAVDSSRTAAVGSLSAALVAARRIAPSLAAEADTVELMLVSPVAAEELDAATDSVRVGWPGRIYLTRVAARADSGAGWSLERALDADDLLAPALRRSPVAAVPTAVRLRRASASAADSAYARAGGTLVLWDTAGAAPMRPTALAMGDDVVVATMGRGSAGGGRALARWSDGAPAASEHPLGAGCVRHVAVGIPLAGDLPLRPAFQRIVRGLVAPCGEAGSAAPADSATVARLVGASAPAAGRSLSADQRQPSPLVPWLLGLALACAMAELLVRGRMAPERV
ncbi:MAG: BatA domain-containing protein [Gemmatimonadaceae bacterium]